MSTRARRQARTLDLRSGRTGQKQRTRRELLSTAVRMLAEGRQPTVEEVSEAARISRRTAYRYFPSQKKLLVEAALEGLRPVMEAALAAAPAGLGERDLERRVDALVQAVYRMTAEHQALLRAMVQLTVLEPPSGGTPRRGTRRIDWVELALQPLKGRVRKASYERLVSGLALVTGIEAFLVLRDIRGLEDAEALRVSRWMAQVMLRCTLEEAPK